MKVAFFGLKNFFDYYQIGGFESYVRRIALEMAHNGDEVDYVIYGSRQTEETKIMTNIRLRYFQSFEEAIQALSESYDHVIRIWLTRRDRPKYILFCRKLSNSTKFHYALLTWPDSIIKRKLKFIEVKIVSFNGIIICASFRLFRAIKKWVKNAVFIFPPVPEDYFINIAEKPKNERIKITFLGILSTNKGIEEVIELFKELKDNSKFECVIYGTYDPKNKNSFEIHNWLKEQKEINYIEVDRKKYSPRIEEMVKEVLKETDIFIQPYKRLGSTLDTPVLLLEAMASLCAIITTPIGSIPEIYGKSEFLIPEKYFLERAKNLLQNITYEKILSERERIFQRNQELKFDVKNVIKAYYETLKR